MSKRYLPEHAQPVLLALDLAKREAKHLRYSQATLFALSIDLAWVQSLEDQPEIAEKVEAFVSRFGRLQDHLGEKLLPRTLALVGEKSKTLLDTLAVAEKLELLTSSDDFVAVRKLRNALIHEYMHDPQTFLDSLFAAQKACEMFYQIIENVQTEMVRLELLNSPS